MLDFVAIVFLFTLDYFVRFRSGVLRGATHKRRLQREGHSLLGVLRGERPEWVIRAKP